MNKYWYCRVAIKGAQSDYSYISDEGRIPAGTYVEVPFGGGNAPVIGVVKACAEYTEEDAPYPVSRTKHIKRIATAEEYEAQAPLQPFYHDDGDAPDYFDEINYYIEDEDWDSVLDWAIRHHDSTDRETLEKVIECYELCIKQNMPTAALNLGTFYYTGRVVEQDYKRAFELYKIAADAGELRAICNCGYCFYYGRHQAVDHAEAFKYFSLGALLFDDANCLYKLGDMYINGYGVQKNEVYAFKLYSRALDQCRNSDEDAAVTADAQFRVGKCLLRGIGTEKDVEEANVLLSLALLNFYKRRKTDCFVSGLISSTKELIAQAQAQLDEETAGRQ